MIDVDQSFFDHHDSRIAIIFYFHVEDSAAYRYERCWGADFIVVRLPAPKLLDMNFDVPDQDFQ